MKLLLLTAALVHCASAMNSNSPFVFSPYVPRGPAGDCAETLKCEGTKTKDNACSDCHEPWRALLGNILDKWQGCMSIADAERREREDQLERYQREKAHMEEKSANPSQFDAFGDPDKGLDFEEDSMLTLLPRKERCSECSEEMKRDATQPKEKATLARVLDCETCGGRGFLFVPHETGPKVSKQLICSMSKYVKGVAEGDNTLDCTKCGKTVAPEQADADQCSECGNEGEGWKAQIVELSQVDAKTLEYIIEYLEILKGFSPEKLDQKHDKGRITKPIRDTNMLKCVHADDLAEGKWIEHIFTDYGQGAIFKIILAANYMEMTPLLHLGCCKIATLIKGQTAEEIKRILSLESVSLGDDDLDKVNSFAAERRRLLKKLLGM